MCSINSAGELPRGEWDGGSCQAANNWRQEGICEVHLCLPEFSLFSQHLLLAVNRDKAQGRGSCGKVLRQNLQEQQ